MRSHWYPTLSPSTLSSATCLVVSNFTERPRRCHIRQPLPGSYLFDPQAVSDTDNGCLLVFFFSGQSFSGSCNGSESFPPTSNTDFSFSLLLFLVSCWVLSPHPFTAVRGFSNALGDSSYHIPGSDLLISPVGFQAVSPDSKLLKIRLILSAALYQRTNPSLIDYRM